MSCSSAGPRSRPVALNGVTASQRTLLSWQQQYRKIPADDATVALTVPAGGQGNLSVTLMHQPLSLTAGLRNNADPTSWYSPHEQTTQGNVQKRFANVRDACAAAGAHGKGPHWWPPRSRGSRTQPLTLGGSACNLSAWARTAQQIEILSLHSRVWCVALHPPCGLASPVGGAWTNLKGRTAGRLGAASSALGSFSARFFFPCNCSRVCNWIAALRKSPRYPAE